MNNNLEYPLSGTYGWAMSLWYPVSVMLAAWLGIKKAARLAYLEAIREIESQVLLELLVHKNAYCDQLHKTFGETFLVSCSLMPAVF